MSAPPQSRESLPVAVLGAGPAGLTAAYRLVQRGQPVVVFEADHQVGGLARTVVRDGYRFDLGGHRFFTKSAEVEALWEELLGPELLVRPRLSRIYWRGRFIEYRLRPAGEEETFEDWVSARFGRRLFELFFKTYTEKVWGVDTAELRAEWAAQRIADLSPWSALREALPGGGGERPKSLIERGGGELRLGSPVERLELENGRLVAVRAGSERVEAAAAISSVPLRTVVGVADPAPPREVSEAAAGLRYRDFLTVALPVEGEPAFPDNWVYVHDPRARVGRIQNFRAWSPWMTPDPRRSCLGLEYFCFEGDELWSSADEDLVELGRREVAQLGLVDPERVVGGHVVRVPKAYPVYDADYEGRVGRIRDWLGGIANLQQVGRNGLHRYNNSDHSMLTALRAVENLCDGADHDVWSVNADSVYHETVEVDEQPYRAAPETPAMARPLAELSD